MIESLLQDTAVVTTTFYPKWYPGETEFDNPNTLVDKVRGDLALQTAQAAKARNVALIVVDGAANKQFKDALATVSTYPHPEMDRGMSPSRQQGFRLAAIATNATIFDWTEPEKVSLVADCLDQLNEPIRTGRALVGVPARDERGLASLPRYQADFEGESNFQWNRLLKESGLLDPDQPDFDAWFGPRSWHRSVMGLFLRKYAVTDPTEETRDLQPAAYCNATFFPIIAALKNGYPVESVTVPYQHPEIQTRIEEDSPDFHKKRADQQRTILATTREYIKLIQGEPSKLTQVA